MAYANPDQHIRESVAYDPATGTIRWLRDTRNRLRLAGDIAGQQRYFTRSKMSYRLVTVGGKEHLAHRLAWFLHYGVWPVGFIDHANRDGLDNRIENLREATRSQNGANRIKNSNNPYKGVFPLPSGNWRATICSRVSGNKRIVHLGCYPTPEEASAAYMRAATEMFGEFARAE